MDKESELFQTLLKRHGYFATKPRLHLFNLLQSEGTFSVKELIRRLPKDDQATVYRNIRLLEELGVVKRLQVGRYAKFELSDIFQHHHHHLSCTNCGRVIVLRVNPVLEELIGRMSVKNGFQPLDHQLEIRGLCRTCIQIVR